MKSLTSPPIIAHLLAWAAFFGVVFWPYGFNTHTTTVTASHIRDEFGHSPGPFIRYLGFEEIMLLLIPLALTGLATWLAWRHGAVWSAWTRPVLWGLGLLCLAYCSVPIWFIEVQIGFIGAFFLPAAAVLIVSAIFVSMSKPTPKVPSKQ